MKETHNCQNKTQPNEAFTQHSLTEATDVSTTILALMSFIKQGF